VVGSRLLTLTSGPHVVAIWRDALPPAHFRRLCVHARWHVERSGSATALTPPATECAN